MRSFKSIQLVHVLFIVCVLIIVIFIELCRILNEIADCTKFDFELTDEIALDDLRSKIEQRFPESSRNGPFRNFTSYHLLDLYRRLGLKEQVYVVKKQDYDDVDI